MKYGFLAIIIATLLAGTSCKTRHMASLYGDGKDTFNLPEVNATSGKAVYQGSKQKFVDLLNTELHLRPDFKKRSISGTALLTIKSHAYMRDSVTLDAKGFEIKNIYELKSDILSPLKYKYDKEQLHISLGHLRGVNELVKIQIEYTALPYSRLENGTIKSKEKLGLTFINADGSDSILPRQMWSQGETEYNSAWFPTIESTDQKMRQDIYLTVDSDLVTISNGKLESKTRNRDGSVTWYWKLDQPHAPYLTMIAAGNWKVIRDSWRGKVPVEYYIEPKYVPYAKLVFGNTPEMIEFYSRVLKYDYPWAKYSQIPVRQYTSGAMENTTATVEFEQMLHDARANLDNTYEDVISHELFHHWFGDLVTCESWDYLSMNESFATLGEFLWKTYKYGQNEGGLRKQEALIAYLREASYNKEAVVNHFYKDPEELFDRHRYEKGGLILEMLRVYLGDEVFFNGLSEYLHERAFKTTELAYLRMKMEEVCGEDLKWFFSQWFEQAGHPDLIITHEYDKKLKALVLSVHQEQKESEGVVYRLPVDVDVYTQTGHTRNRITVKHRIDSFFFPMEQEPLLVNFDATKYLLCHKMEGKSKEEWMYQYYHAPLYLDKFEALNSLALVQKDFKKDSILVLLRTSLNDPFWSLRKTALEVFFDKADNYQGEFRDKIKKMALHDPKSQVRVQAIQTIQAREKEQGESIFRECLKDSSYAVVSASLDALFNELPLRDSVEKMQIAAKFENYDNSYEVLNELISLYGKYAGPDKLPFFHKLPYILADKHLGSFLSAYKKILMKSNAQLLKSELPFIAKINHKMTSFWELMSYKSLLSDFANALHDNKLPNGGLSSSEMKSLQTRVQTMADEVDLKNFGY